MNRGVMLGVVVLVLVGLVAFFVGQSRMTAPPPPVADAPQPAPAVSGTDVQVQPLEIAGSVEVLDEAVNRLAVELNGVTVADVPLEANRYRLTLPGKIAGAPLADLGGVALPNGPGRLRGEAVSLGANATFRAYVDENGDQKLETGERSVELVPIKASLDADLRAFFRYRLVLVSGPASLEESLDSATGAKGYYRYKVRLDAGWRFLEGELESNGYAIRGATGTDWDLTKPVAPRVGPSAAER